MSHSGYSHAWATGHRAGRLFGHLAIMPFWRGRKYSEAWMNGWKRGLIVCWWCGR